MNFGFQGRKLIFTNGFKKQTQKTPKGEIALAIQRQRAYRSSQHGR